MNGRVKYLEKYYCMMARTAAQQLLIADGDAVSTIAGAAAKKAVEQAAIVERVMCESAWAYHRLSPRHPAQPNCTRPLEDVVAQVNVQVLEHGTNKKRPWYN